MSYIEKNNKQNKQKLLDAAAEQWVELILQQIFYRKQFPKSNKKTPINFGGISYGTNK